MRRLKKKIYLGMWGTTLALLTVVRACNPDLAKPKASPVQSSETSPVQSSETSPVQSSKNSELCTLRSALPLGSSKNSELASQKTKPHPVRGVHSYQECFPDLQDVQIVAARRWGVRPVRDRQQAEERKSELVYIGSNPYYAIDRGMSSSIPYLVPRAADLLQQIARNYLDSLALKGVPLHRIIVTSVLRSEQDVARLLRHNGNASDQSCHRFGTTFDIAQNRYATVEPPGQSRRAVRNDTLKWVLSEVLRDLRQQGRCYVKYEVKQGCFHITTR